MKKRMQIGLLAVLAIALFCIGIAMADPQLECQGELPGGYAFTGPEEITVRITVSNIGDENMPGPLYLLNSDLEPVEEFGSPVLAAGSSRTWEGTWNMTQQELEAGEINFYVYYPMMNKETGELDNKGKKLSFKIVYTDSEIKYSIKRSTLPETAQKGQEVSITYEIANIGMLELTNIYVIENADISNKAGYINCIAPGEIGTVVFTTVMDTEDLISDATIMYRAGNEVYSEKVDAVTIKYDNSDIELSEDEAVSEQYDVFNGVRWGDSLEEVQKTLGKGELSDWKVISVLKYSDLKFGADDAAYQFCFGNNGLYRIDIIITDMGITEDYQQIYVKSFSDKFGDPVKTNYTDFVEGTVKENPKGDVYYWNESEATGIYLYMNPGLINICFASRSYNN